jgi:protein-tyrosine-phosphatase
MELGMPGDTNNPGILFVCTANQCRSPMASILFQNLVNKPTDIRYWRIESAGTWAIDGIPAAESAQIVMERRGLDLGQHKSRGVNAEMLSSFDLILTMESGHKESLRIEFPKVAKRVFLLSEMTGKQFDIHDPIGGSIDDYEATATELERLLIQGFENITKIAQDNFSEHDETNKSTLNNIK